MIDFNPKELKNKILELECLRLGSNFEGVCSYNGFTIFVYGALPTEIVKFRVERVEKRYAYGKLLDIIKYSESRQKPACQYFGKCGGCSCQHINYTETLNLKGKKVEDSLKYIAKIDKEVPAAIGLKDPWHSRNKTSLPVRDVNGEVQIGFYKRQSHDIINIEHCPISKHEVEIIIKLIREWISDYFISVYNEKAHKGNLRHIVVRSNSKGEYMVVLVTKDKNLPHTEQLAKSLKDNIKGFVSLQQNINEKASNIILGNKTKLLYGNKSLIENFFDIDFEVGPMSFLQVNYQQTLNLYELAVEMASINKNDICIDAYAGAGTIALIISKFAKKVIGIEIVEEAVKNAINNADNNNIKNVEFIPGAVEVVYPNLVKDGLKADIVILDPPRKGVDEAVIKALQENKPRKIVYVSCNPATLARDINLLVDAGFKLENVNAVDMFCYSSEIESIALLTSN